MDRQLIAAAFKKTGRPKGGLAKALGISQSGVSEILKGGRLIKAHEVPLIRSYFGLDRVPLKGFVGAGGTAEYFPLPDDELDQVPAPDNATPNTVAVEIRGDSMGEGFHGWLAYYDDVQRRPSRLKSGTWYVVGLSDGRVLIKTVKKSKVKGLFHLSSANGAAINDVPIEWAARVKQFRLRD